MKHIFLKLGGSLITDKHLSRTPRRDTIRRLANEINLAMRSSPNFQLIIGHGSGSFGHIPASKYGTRKGVRTTEQWQGFIEVFRQARELNQIVLDILGEAGLPVIAFPPSACIFADDGQVSSMNPDPFRSALNAGLIPLVNGDVVFDRARGATILSTEDVFVALADFFTPDAILLCGMDEGVFEDFPQCTRLISNITYLNKDEIFSRLGGSAAIDVTGGMVEKVRLMLAMVERIPSVRASIFSGNVTGNLQDALIGKEVGTTIRRE
jgi:isopentenyl phosphate kinase